MENDTSKLLGNNLIFLISQPRAGSTMLQRILGCHPEIHTVSEPWLALHPLYALRSEGFEAEYDERLARHAVQDYLQTLPNGEDEYIKGVRKLLSSLYNCALNNSEKKYFLDKTPRYYLIIPELVKTFPEAKFIILIRNPLAVLCSIINTWTKRKWFNMFIFKNDIIRAPKLLIDGIELLENKAHIVHYESILDDPEREIQLICNKLGIGFSREMINYGRKNYNRWQYGDQDNLNKLTKPDLGNANKWIDYLHDAQIWRLINDYLSLLGPETIEKMDYSYEELHKVIDDNTPNKFSNNFTFSLSWLLSKSAKERNMVEYILVRLLTSLSENGIGGTGVKLVSKIVNALSISK